MSNKGGNTYKNQRKQAEYLANPNLCLYCDKPILPKSSRYFSQASKKKFCSRSCAMAHSNKTVHKRKKGFVACKFCGTLFTRNGHRLCDKCWNDYSTRLARKTKGECSHEDIRGHARSAMNGREKICTHCGYSKFVEICHIHPVGRFPKTALLTEINDPANLVYLCPNCHWEFDHGTLFLSRA